MTRARIIFIILFLAPFFSQAQDLQKKAEEIWDEGKLLYQTEMASWYGTDMFLLQFDELEKIAGYFSYLDEEVPTCVFFSHDEIPEVLGTITFDSTYILEKAEADLTIRNFTPMEEELFKLRKSALLEVETDTMFKTYQNTNLNLIPIITKNEKKVYILTGPTQAGVVLIGNDYLLQFDDNNKVLSKKELHKNLIPIAYAQPDDKSENAGITMHTHLTETGDFVTATDICTLMLYGKFTGWKSHYTVSKDYMSIFDCSTNNLSIVSMEVLDKIQKDQEKRKKDKKK